MEILSIYNYFDSLFIGAAITLFSVSYLLHLRMVRTKKSDKRSLFSTYSSALFVAIVVAANEIYNNIPTINTLSIIFISCITFLTVVIIIYATYKDHEHIGVLLLFSLIIGSGFLMIYSFRMYNHFLSGQLSMKLFLLISTFLFAILSTFVSLRFFQQLARSNFKNLLWILIGAISIGATFTSIRYSVFASANLFMDPLSPNKVPLDISLLPFTVILFAVLIIVLTTSIIHEKNRSLLKRMYDALLNNPTIAVITTDSNGCIFQTNSMVFEMTGYKESELVGKYVHDFFKECSDSTRGSKPINFTFSELIEKNETTFIIVKRNNKSVDLEVSFIPLKEINQIVGWYVILKDNTENVKLEREKDYLLGHDQLTGLANRKLFQTYIEEKVDNKKPFTLFLIGIDRFRRINETKGHSIAENLLKQVSSRLDLMIGNRKQISRVAGDEFAFIIDGHFNENELELYMLGQKITGIFRNPFKIEGNEIYLSCRIGISVFPKDSNLAQTLLKNAAIALEKAKEDKKDLVFYSKMLAFDKNSKYELEDDLRKAEFNKEFKLHYQPQINIKTRKICGVEALIRWQHPKKGMIPPNLFIPLAEEIGLINKIGEWVLYNACRQNKKWQDEGLEKVKVSVNLAMEQFYDRSFVSKLKMILKITKLEPQYLDLEITESMAMKNLKYSIETFNEIKDIGVQLSIDDFGKGYSSFSHIKDIPIDRIKIDRSFINDVETNKEAEVIIRSILLMASNLKLISLAEGVENKQQETILKKYNCNEIQGYLYSPPIKANELRRILN